MLFVEIELAMADEIPEKIFGFINSFSYRPPRPIVIFLGAIYECIDPLLDHKLYVEIVYDLIDRFSFCPPTP